MRSCACVIPPIRRPAPARQREMFRCGPCVGAPSLRDELSASAGRLPPFLAGISGFGSVRSWHDTRYTGPGFMSFQRALPPWLTKAVEDAGEATVILKP